LKIYHLATLLRKSVLLLQNKNASISETQEFLKANHFFPEAALNKSTESKQIGVNCPGGMVQWYRLRLRSYGP
jgi:hypothetical protein